MWKFIKERAGERSTRLAVITFVAGLVGIQFAPEQTEAISQVGAAILALVLTFTKEEK